MSANREVSFSMVLNITLCEIENLRFILSKRDIIYGLTILVLGIYTCYKEFFEKCIFKSYKRSTIHVGKNPIIL